MGDRPPSFRAVSGELRRGERAAELVPRPDAQLPVCRTELVLYRLGRHEQRLGDLAGGNSTGGHGGHTSFACRQGTWPCNRAPPWTGTGGPELVFCPPGQ